MGCGSWCYPWELLLECVSNTNCRSVYQARLLTESCAGQTEIEDEYDTHNNTLWLDMPMFMRWDRAGTTPHRGDG